MSDEKTEEKVRLVGLHLGTSDAADGKLLYDWINYDIGVIAYSALHALQIAVLAFEQIVTGERLVHSLDVGDFYAYINEALEVENGQGIGSEPGNVGSLQDEIQALIDLVGKAREIARRPRGE